MFLLFIKISSYISYRINLKSRIMGMLKEFKAFAMKGNVVDMAVGIVIGAAFGKIVASVVNDIIMPPIGLLVGGVNFSELQIVLKEAVGETAAVTINYGNFIQVVFDFLIIAFRSEERRVGKECRSRWL